MYGNSRTKKIHLFLWWRVEGGIVVTVLHGVAGTDGGALKALDLINRLQIVKNGYYYCINPRNMSLFSILWHSTSGTEPNKNILNC
jgi:hypothetical protein